MTDGKRVYVYLGSAHELFAVDFSGRLVWSTAVKQPEIQPDLIPAASGAPLSGDLLNMGTAASPALHNDRIYIVSDHKGPPQDARHDVGEWFLASFDARSGREVWRANHVKKEDAYGWSTPFVWENGLRTEIFALSEDGDTYVIQAGPEFTVLRKNSLGEMALATPAIMRGSVIIRTASSLRRIAKPAAK